MTNQPEQQKLHELVESLLNETITPEEHATLQELMLSNPAAQQQYFDHIDLHQNLGKLSSIQAEVDPAADSLNTRRVQKEHAKARPHLWRWGVLASVLALAAIFVAAKPELWRRVAEPGSEQLATTEQAEQQPEIPATSPLEEVLLSQAAGAELVRELVPELNSPLEFGHEYTLFKGMMELKFSSGATAIIQSPAVFVVTSAERIDLKIGNCSVHAPDGAEGFEVITPKSRVVDLGTRFSVSVDDYGSSDIQVVEGAAEVHSLQESEQSATLVQGEAGRCETNQKGLKTIQFNETQFQRSLPDRVVSYEATQADANSGVRDLTSVTVQRGGKSQTYSAEELIGIDILHFSAFNNAVNALSDMEIPANLNELLTDDFALSTGLINFNRDPKSGDKPAKDFTQYQQRSGLAIRFRQPVVNGPGPDVVLFEIQSVVYPPEGDHFRVSPIENGSGLHAHDVTRFDITMNSANARKVAAFEVINFEHALKSIPESSNVDTHRGGPMALPFFALAVGIDLSDLGYPAGAEVNGLFIEDTNDGKIVSVDPVFIGGLPAAE